MLGQRNGEHGRRPLICIHDCSSIASSRAADDDLKGFHQVMAVQGTPEQSTALVGLVNELQTAKEQLQKLRGMATKSPASALNSDGIVVFDQSLAGIRTRSENFLGSFSDAQKSGLKDLTKKMEESNAELGREEAGLHEASARPNTTYADVATGFSGMDKTLANVEEDQLALAREMGIIVPTTELVFNLTAANPMSVGGSVMSVPVSGTISRTSSVDGHNVFAAKFVADLTDLQGNIKEILRSQVAQWPACGQRIDVQEAMLLPEAPASHIFARIHMERWICLPGERGEGTEVASGEGSLDLKLIPIEKQGKLGLKSEIRHVDGDAFVRGSLSGDAGQALEEKITRSLISAMQEAADLKLLLPSAARESTIVDKAEFQPAAGGLALVLDGGLEFSDQQTQEFASQIKQQSLSAQQRSSP